MLIVLIAVVVVIVVLVTAFMSMWKVAEANEALVVTGAGAGGTSDVTGGADEPSYKIVVGKGSLVIPGLQSAARLSLNAKKADLTVRTVTQQGVPVEVRGVVVYKVGNTPKEITNAASRFLGESPEVLSNTVDELFSGHLRSILGGLTMEQIIGDRSRLAAETRESSAEEMETLGLRIDSLQIQEVGDPSGYIQNLAAPHQAAVERDARIAQAEANRAATEKEQEAAALAAKAVADSEIAQSQVKAAADTAKEQAAQAGPLAQAQAQKQVVVEQTEVAKLEAARREMELQTETVKPAQAARDARVAAAEGEARRPSSALPPTRRRSRSRRRRMGRRSRSRPPRRQPQRSGQVRHRRSRSAPPARRRRPPPRRSSPPRRRASRSGRSRSRRTPPP